MAFVICARGYNYSTAEKKFHGALEYLRISDMAKFVVDSLEDAEEKITIVIAEDSENMYAHPKGKPGSSGGIIVWNPESGLRIVNTKAYFWNKKQTISPFLALFHEMGHAYQYLSETEGYLKFKKEQKEKKHERNILEDTNVAALENTVALELRSSKKWEGIRWKYEDLVPLTKKESESAMQQSNLTTNIFGAFDYMIKKGTLPDKSIKFKPK